MRRILAVVLGLLLLVLLVVAGLFFAIPDSFLRSQIEDMVQEATGRRLTIAGDFRLRRWPPVAIEASDIRFANPGWAGAGDMLRIRSLELDLDAWGMLSGKLVVLRFVVDEPDIALVRDAEGRGNWQFGGVAAPAGAEPASEKTEEAGGVPDFLELRELRIERGRLRYLNQGSGEERRAENISLAVLEDPATRALSLEGSLELDGAPLRLSAEVSDPRALAAGSRGEMRLRFELPEGSVAFAGQVLGETPEVGGTLDVAFTDLRGALDRFGVAPELPEGTLGTLALTATLNASPRAVGLQELEFALDDLTASGRLGATGLDGRPRLTAELAFGPLALDPYLPPEATPAAEEAGPTAAAQQEKAGWPEDPIVLPLPLPLDADLDVTFESLSARGIRLGKGHVKAVVEGPEAKLELVELEAYDGRTTLDAQLTAGTPHQLAVKAQASGLRMAPLLAAAAGFTRLEGSGDIELELTTRGLSVKDMVAALDGRGKVMMRDGAIVGVNIAAMVRQVMTLGQEGADAPPKTDFAALGGSFTIAEGILENRDLLLKAPLLRVDGEGTVNLPERTLRYRLRPALAATLEGQGAAAEPTLKAGVPIVISGPWDAIEWRFDIGGTLTEAIGDPGKIGELVGKLKADPEMLNKLGTRLGGALEGVGGLVGGVLGGGSESRQSAPPPATGESPQESPLGPARKLLQGIIGR